MSLPGVGMLARANLSLKPNGDLINTKFEQYKYTSGREHEVTYRELQHSPYRTKQSDREYSYQMTRASCLFNCLFANSDSSRFIYLTQEDDRYSLVDAEQGLLLATFQNSENLIYSVTLVWNGADEIFLCLGSDLYALTLTSSSATERSRQKLEKQCLLLYSYVQDGAVHLVTCHKLEEVYHHRILKQDSEDVQFKVVANIKLSGIARFVSVKDKLLTVICEGKLLVPEPQEVVETSEEAGEKEKENKAVSKAENKNYTWTQTMDDVEVSVQLPTGIVKSDLNVEIGLDSLEVRTKGGQELFKSKLFGKVEPKESVWQMSSDKRKLEVHLTKYQTAHNWAHLLDTPNFDRSGNLLSQISDLGELDLQNVMRRMQSLNEYTSDTIDKSPLFTPSGDLEECDELDGQQILITGYELTGGSIKQRYLVELAPGSLLFSQADRGFVVRHNVDACFYKANTLSNPWEHTATFHAFNMIQSTKTHKKFMLTGPLRGYAAIVDISRYIYIYNTTNNSDFGKLLVMTLDHDDSEILGACPQKNKIILLTEKNLITINFAL